MYGMSAAPEPAAPAPAAPGLPAAPWSETPEFWVVMVYAIGLGVFGAFVGLAFIALIGAGNNWYNPAHPGWGGGHWWWVAVTAASGVVVGLLRRWTRLPMSTPGLIADVVDEHVKIGLVPGIVAVSAASLIGGASLGPEKALGSMGGGVAGWVSRRRGLSEEDQQANTLSGFAGAYAGLFSSPLIATLGIWEVARPGGQRGAKAVAGMIVASSVSLGIYFAIAGAVFLDMYKVPHYQFHDWQLLAGIGFGFLAAVLVALLVLMFKLVGGLFGRLKAPNIVKSTLGGVVFGLVGVALPLTMFTGSDQLNTVLHDRGVTLGLGILVALVIAKMLTFAVSMMSGFVGGPIFPALFIGGTAGIAVHQAIPSIPLGLAFTCLLAAIPGALVSAPFAFVLLAALLTQVGALQTAPMLIAVITAFLTIEGVKYYLLRHQATKKAATAATATAS
jgi:H+/Cl- antiporter ClcA